VLRLKPDGKPDDRSYNLWFGIYRNGEVEKSADLLKSFLNCVNQHPLPFSVSEIGSEVFGDIKEYYRILRKTAIAVAETQIEREVRREDRYVIALVKSLEEIDEAINMLNEKLEEIRSVKEGKISDEFEDKIRNLRKLRRDIEKEIERVTEKIAPNLSEVVGSTLAAKLIEKAGSLEKLAMLPASKIQIMGAEKSLYKAFARMKKGKPAKVPKHGVIFRHPFIRTLPKAKRGKMARFLATKIAIAARLDFFRGELEEKLSEEVARRFEELRRR
jgi:nucleolar protein 56